MFDDEKDRSKSFADQIADGLSFDPKVNSKTDDTLAETISRAIANDMTKNHPDRHIFGDGNAAKNTTQDLFDSAFNWDKSGDS